jgi:hypothetical protein
MSYIPYDMLDKDPFPTAPKLESLYHVGQRRIWDGKQVLEDLLQKHGAVELPEGETEAVRDLFAVLLWGELAAWKISAALAYDLDTLEAKLAATAQAHDESRHFYVMKDYLALLGPIPRSLKPKTNKMLTMVMGADTTAKMLVGMQLMIEPMALTLFKLVRKLKPEPVLEELLVLIERDEARHVGLGTLYLPEVLRQISSSEEAGLAVWQMRMYMAQFEMLKEMAPAFEALGISVREVFESGRKKQVAALRALMEEMGEAVLVVETMLRVIDFKAELDFPERDVGLIDRIRSGMKAAKEAPQALRAGIP